MPKKQKPTANAEQIALMGIQFTKNKEAIKELESANKKLREPLEDYLVENGTLVSEESGHRVCVLTHAGVDVTLKYTHKMSPVLQPDALDIIKENGLTDAIETVEIVREDVLERMYDEGKIPDEVFKSLYAKKESDAFSVTAKPSYR